MAAFTYCIATSPANAMRKSPFDNNINALMSSETKEKSRRNAPVFSPEHSEWFIRQLRPCGVATPRPSCGFRRPDCR
jgi:hypothetical protein